MVQLDKPGQFAKESQLMGHSVEGYEPPPGHPDWVDESLDVGSNLYGATKEGWEGLKSGQTQVFSFRDSKNRPHATLEIKAPKKYTEDDVMEQFPSGVLDAMKANGQAGIDEYVSAKLQELNSGLPQIVQIKGKVNNLVNEDYWPYLQRYVRESGMPVTDDLDKIGMVDTRGVYDFMDMPRYMTKTEYDRLHKTGEFTPDPHFASPEFAPKKMKRGGRVNLANPLSHIRSHHG
jgi:hypothetical protein